MRKQKKRLKIYGVPICPIEVGNTALISEGMGLRHTSTVMKLIAVSKRKIRFETKNTRYCLCLIDKTIGEEADAI